MSQYATYEEFLQYGGIPERVLQSAKPPVTPADVEKFLESASGIFDSYVAQKYSTSIPLQTWNATVIMCVCVIAAHFIMAMRVGYKPDGSDKSFEKGYKAQIDWLTAVSNGTAFLPGVEGIEQKDDYSGPDVISNPRRYDGAECYRDGFWQRR